jgi:hypothetical protein
VVPRPGDHVVLEPDLAHREYRLGHREAGAADKLRTPRAWGKRTKICREQEELDIRRCDLMASVEREVLGVIRDAPAELTEEERTITLAEALKARELESPKWCAECDASERRPGGGDGCASMPPAFNSWTHSAGSPTGDCQVDPRSKSIYEPLWPRCAAHVLARQ